MIAMLLVGIVGSIVFTRANAPEHGSERPQLRSPSLARDDALGPLEVTPSAAPSQAGADLVGRPLATNQWWTSALTGPGTQNLWAFPVVTRVRPGAGIDITRPDISASADVIRSDLVPDLTLVDAVGATEVLDYDEFSVVLGVTRSDGAQLRMRVAQGSPALWIDIPAGPITLVTTAAQGLAAPPEEAATSLRVDVDGHEWTLTGDRPLQWSADEATLSADVAEPMTLTFVPTPEAPVPGWSDLVAQLSAHPVTGTRSEISVDWSAGSVSQRLIWESDADDGLPVALLPHQWLALSESPPVLGEYPTVLGPLRVVKAKDVDLTVPLPGLLPGVPAVDLGSSTNAEIAALVDEEGVGELDGGSYFGPKQLSRLATLVELQRRVGASDRSLAASLETGVVDWLTYSGPADARWLAWDSAWGGVVGQPPEFGNEDYNDHHFQYGYLIHAAAVVAEGDPGFVAEYGDLVDLLALDLLGDAADPSVPERRLVNAYLGHSSATGFAPFADGANQESSSEAVHAWWATTRWALVTGDDALVRDAAALYALEAWAARAYWLDELGVGRPEGYAHQVAGIVWNGKLDFTTFFDPRAGAVIGIQLIPVNFGSIYRADPGAALARFGAGALEPVWPDIAAMDLALADPDRARSELMSAPIETGNTLAFGRYWTEVLANLGPPRHDVRPDGPFGAAFGDGAELTLVAVNPTREIVRVTFRRDDQTVGTLVVAPGQSATRRTNT